MRWTAVSDYRRLSRGGVSPPRSPMGSPLGSPKRPHSPLAQASVQKKLMASAGAKGVSNAPPGIFLPNMLSCDELKGSERSKVPHKRMEQSYLCLTDLFLTGNQRLSSPLSSGGFLRRVNGGTSPVALTRNVSTNSLSSPTMMRQISVSHGHVLLPCHLIPAYGNAKTDLVTKFHQSNAPRS